MKIEILKENLKSGLSITERVVGKNISLPILNNVLLTTEDSFLNLTSTDLETVVQVWILSKIIQKGSLVVPAKLLSSFISHVSEDKITLEAKEQNVCINSRGFKTQIQGFNPEEFPLIPSVISDHFLTIDNQMFCQALSQVVTIASLSQTRPETSGIYFSASHNKLIIAATDSFRLGEKTITLEKGVEKEFQCIVPQKAAREILAILETKKGNVIIRPTANQILFEVLMEETNHPQIRIISRLIEGQYPQYQEIIPNTFITHIIIRKEEFLSHIKTASLFSNRNNEVKIMIDPEKREIHILSQNPTLGEHASLVSGNIEGEATAVSFNYKFLIDGISHIKSSEIMFGVSRVDGPCILRPVGDISYLYVVMPIKSMQ